MIRSATTLGMLALALAACGGGEEADTAPKSPADLTGELKAAYDKCIYDRQAEAVAIEVIELSCFEQVTGNSDPLGKSVV